MVWEDGGEIIPMFNNYLFGAQDNLSGFVEAPVLTGPAGRRAGLLRLAERAAARADGEPASGWSLRRLALGLLTIWAASVVIFVATEILPGDVATAVLGQAATPAALANMRAQLDLDRPARAALRRLAGRASSRATSAPRSPTAGRSPT